MGGDRRNFESQIVPRVGKLILFGAAAGGIACSWYSLQDCKFFTVKLSEPDHQPAPYPLDNAKEASVGLMQFSIIEFADSYEPPLEVSSDDLELVKGECIQYPDSFR